MLIAGGSQAPLGELSEEDKAIEREEIEAALTYRFVKNAQWAGVPPWELLRVEPWWEGVINACRTAENLAEKHHIEKAKARRKTPKRRRH